MTQLTESAPRPPTRIDKFVEAVQALMFQYRIHAIISDHTFRVAIKEDDETVSQTYTAITKREVY